MKKHIIIVFLVLHLFIPVVVHADSNRIGVKVDKASNLFYSRYDKLNNNSIGIDLNTNYRAGFLKGKLAANNRKHTPGWFAITTVYLSVTIAGRLYPAAAGALLIPAILRYVDVKPSPREMMMVSSYNSDFERGFLEGYNHKIHSDMTLGWGLSVLLTSVALIIGILGSDTLDKENE